MERRSPRLSSAGNAVKAYGYMAAWIGLSAGLILLNKYILAPELGGFPFPLALTTLHMALCSAVAAAAVRLRLVAVQEMPAEAYWRCVVPVGLLFSGTLWAGNAAILHLSVSFIQMLKASMPMLVFVCGLALGTERWSARTGAILAVVVAGVLTASHGELVFVWVGVAQQVASLACEALRLTLVQQLLQQRGFRLNPLSTMYFVSPVCLAALLAPLVLLEARQVLAHDWARGVRPALLLGSAAAAFALNVSVFLLVGATSALTMNVAGVVKDVLLIVLSVALLGSVVTRMQVVGYAIALGAVVVYNVTRLRQQQQQQQSLKQKQQQEEEHGAAGLETSHGPQASVSATIRLAAAAGPGGGGKGEAAKELQQQQHQQQPDAEQLLLRASWPHEHRAPGPHTQPLAGKPPATRLVLHVKR